MLIHVSSFLSKTPVETLSEADASSAYPKAVSYTHLTLPTTPYV